MIKIKFEIKRGTKRDCIQEFLATVDKVTKTLGKKDKK
ncbi:hypothetical protein LCGC14_1027210 [marine sediment metagenome]|uniref:Uncharacterized protein n=1 Tax=marine sediment metagenome TaxID=412755 RepID=A0A0F9QDU7_9ZZZZ